MVRQEIYGYLLTHYALSALIRRAATEASTDMASSREPPKSASLWSVAARIRSTAARAASRVA